MAGLFFDKRCCKVSFEDEMTQHGIKHVDTADGGNGEDLKCKTVGMGMELQAV